MKKQPNKVQSQSTPRQMHTLSELQGLRGKDVTCHYDILAHCVRLEFGRFYEDQDEAEFLGDHIDEGQPSGFSFEGVSNYSASNEENLQVGQLQSIEIQHGTCILTLAGLAPDLAGRVTFSFRAIEQIRSQRK